MLYRLTALPNPLHIVYYAHTHAHTHTHTHTPALERPPARLTIVGSQSDTCTNPVYVYPDLGSNAECMNPFARMPPSHMVAF